MAIPTEAWNYDTAPLMTNYATEDDYSVAMTDWMNTQRQLQSFINSGVDPNADMRTPEQIAYDQYAWNVTDNDVRNMNNGSMSGQYAKIDPVTGMGGWEAITPDAFAVYNNYKNSLNNQPYAAGYGNQGGQGSTANSSAGASNYGGPNIPVPPADPRNQTNPWLPATPPTPPVFTPGPKVDYTGQRNLENSLKNSLKAGNQKNVEYGFRQAQVQNPVNQTQKVPGMTAPSAPKTGFLSSFK